MNTDTFLEIIRKDFPLANDIQMYTEGWDHVVFSVNSKIAYRFPKNIQHQNQLCLEAKFVKVFSEFCSTEIPHIETKVHNDLIYGVYPFIQGTFLSYDSAKCLNQESIAKICQELGTFLKEIHSFPVARAKTIGIVKMDLVKFWMKKLTQTIEMFSLYLDNDEINVIQSRYNKFLELITQFPIEHKVNHSDLKPPHIIIDVGSLSGIIDFSEVVIGDPAYDFQYLGRYGKKFLEQVYKSYGEQDAYFETRRIFYEYLSHLEPLESAILINDKSLISREKGIISGLI
ncbi:MAG TPA: phosphotransferase [Candidatus Nitrosocosmicus sp.]|nr:phosphotransferase [Candidatus Nitrosocosmicus sp.]